MTKRISLSVELRVDSGDYRWCSSSWKLQL